MAAGANDDVALQRQVLVELAHWLGRVSQYSLTHPASTELGLRFHATLERALEREPELVYGILKDDVMIGEVAAGHPAVRSRVAAHLHDRGVLALHFLRGVSIEDLQGFVELALLPTQAIFDRGGLLRLTLEHGLARIQIDELVHDISEAELESGRRRRRLRDLFTEALQVLVARRTPSAPFGELVAELLEHAAITVTILEDKGAGIAEAAAALALMVQQEEQRTGEVLAPKLRQILAALAPMTRDRLLIGFPPLVDEFRAALAWAMRGYRELELGRFVFPAVRARAHELDVPLYALSVLVPHDGTRLSTLRRVGAMLHDLPHDDTVATEVLGALAQPTESFDSYHREREILLAPAGHALNGRQLAALALAPEPALPLGTPRAGGAGAIREIVAMAARTRQFERFCRRLPDTADALAADGAVAGVLELTQALAAVDRPEYQAQARAAAVAIVAAQAPALLAALAAQELESAAADELARLVPLLRALVQQSPGAALAYLDTGENATLRKLVLEHLPHAGARLVPLVRARLTAEVPVPRALELLGLLARLDAHADDLVAIARHPEVDVRLEVVRVLRLLPQSERTMDVVVHYLADPAPRMRVAVRVLLRGDLLGAAAIAGVARLLADEQQPEELHRRLVSALGHSADDAAAQLLFRTMEPRGLIDPAGAAGLRDLAAVALRESPAAAAGRLFEQAQQSTSRRVRKACERALRGAS